MKRMLLRYPRITGAGLLLMLLAYVFCLPSPLFDTPTSMVLEDRHGNLLGARIAADGQWRFPAVDTVPEKFARALVAFEDRRFYYHPGVDPLGLGRALVQNLRNGRIVSGGSTLTMQVVRMARGNPPRTIWQKFLEIILATRLELGYRKQNILALYASHAPFGGNVVGLEAAAWRYFAKEPDQLSWGEAATLAVLPNSPGLIHPGRNRQALLAKRDRLLDRLLGMNLLDSLDCELAKAEPLPDQPHPLPRLTPHLLDRAYLEEVAPGRSRASRIRTTIDPAIQQQLNDILERHQQLLSHNEIHNLAAVVADVETGDVLAYAGNVLSAGAVHNAQVDVIRAPRSTGSILKPLLYALALQEGTILPSSLLPDIPTYLDGYRPENFHEQYDGLVPARSALIRSLNVPMVLLLQEFGLEKFHYHLQQLGFSHIIRPPGHYGLPLILGGAEASLWDLTAVYAGMARTLVHYYPYDGRYAPRDFRPLNYRYGAEEPPPARNELLAEAPRISAGAAWLAFEAMQEVERPDAEGNWERFQSSRRIAWKTGTSFGFRDAWAIGVTPRYVVGVWAGNADGEGRPGLVGVLAAAPVLFDIVNRLPGGGEWFDPPFDALVRIPVCRQSGYRALVWCEADSLWAPRGGLKAPGCPYHQLVHLDASGQWRVHADCEPPGAILHRPWFVLPPVEAHYYQSTHPDYQELPPLRADCQNVDGDDGIPSMQLIYPKRAARIYVPIDLDGQPSRTVFAVAHRRPEQTIYWHLDDEYIGSTHQFHSMELMPSPGAHLLTLVDAQGNRLEQRFEIIEKK